MTILVVDHMENTIGKIINTLKSLIQGNVQVSKGKKKKYDHQVTSNFGIFLKNSRDIWSCVAMI